MNKHFSLLCMNYYMFGVDVIIEWVIKLKICIIIIFYIMKVIELINVLPFSYDLSSVNEKTS